MSKPRRPKVNVWIRMRDDDDATGPSWGFEAESAECHADGGAMNINLVSYHSRQSISIQVPLDLLDHVEIQRPPAAWEAS